MLNKNSFQGVNTERWKELSKTQERNVYKLVFKKEWNQSEQKIDGNKSAKGAVGLVRVSWGTDNGGRGIRTERAEEVKTEDSNKVWLIIAKSESSIYLIPVVRSSNKWGESECKSWVGKENPEVTIRRGGVQTIEKWNQRFDRSRWWRKEKNEELKKAMGEGFSIIRRGNIAFLGSWGFTSVKKLENAMTKIKEMSLGGWNKSYLGKENLGYVYQNAGKLEIKGNNEKEGCNNKEDYFPLDIAVLGDASKIKEEGKEYLNVNQKIEVKDKITQVISFSL